MPINNIDDIAFNIITKKPIIATSKEIQNNPPSRSAKLRAVKRKRVNNVDTKFIFEEFKYLLEIEKITSKL